MPLPSEGAGGGGALKPPKKVAGTRPTITASGGQSTGGGGYVAPSNSYQPSTTSSGSYSGGGAPAAPPRSNTPGEVVRTAPPPEPKPPSLNEFLSGDNQYQADRNNLIRNFRALKAKNVDNRGDLRSNKNLTLERLGTEQANALKAMQDDFAARGLFGSGVFQDELNEFNLGYENQRNDANTSFRNNLAQLITDMQDARRGRNTDLRQLRLDAIRRRAEKFGLQ